MSNELLSPDAPSFRPGVQGILKTESAQPLTRRELRERERQAETGSATEAGSVDAAPSVAAPITPVAEAVASAPAVAAVPVEAAPVEEAPIEAPVDAAPVEEAPVVLESEAVSLPATTTIPIQLPTRAEARRQEAAQQRSVVAIRSTRPAPAPTARAAKPAAAPDAGIQKPRRSRRARATKGFAVTSLVAAGAMVLATSLPAVALMSPAEVQAQAYAAQQIDTSGLSSDEKQTLSASGSHGDTVKRDSYESSTVTEIAAATGIRIESDFTNNPNGTIQWPFAVGVHIGDLFGHRDCAGCSSNHGGQDFNPGNGAPTQSIADGVVRYVEDGEGSLGVHVIIDHMIDGRLISSVYAHLQHGSVRVTEGQAVKVADVVGLVGTTGMSTGPHLHFEIRLDGVTKTDPLIWLRANTN